MKVGDRMKVFVHNIFFNFSLLLVACLLCAQAQFAPEYKPEEIRIYGK